MSKSVRVPCPGLSVWPPLCACVLALLSCWCSSLCSSVRPVTHSGCSAQPPAWTPPPPLSTCQRNQKEHLVLFSSLKNVISTVVIVSLVHKTWIYRIYIRLYEAATHSTGNCCTFCSLSNICKNHGCIISTAFNLCCQVKSVIKNTVTKLKQA